ncbi:MAG: type II toxin-antitoxin system RelB/DinJ family antitoxin [Propionibacteriaceae bacterium]|nr:type II toxin-antitoxin system RelB/DinJ family antitoxin [Propionibacteriaceae bacterium]
MSTATVTVRLDQDVKRQAEDLLDELGLTMTAAVTVFIKQMIRERQLPFRVSADPFYSEANQERLRASIDRLNRGQGGVSKTLDELEALTRG